METATQYIAFGQAAAKLLYGRDIKHVLLLHIGGFGTVMLPPLLGSLRRQGFKFITLPAAAKNPAYRNDPDFALKNSGTLIYQMTRATTPPLPPHNDRPHP